MPSVFRLCCCSDSDDEPPATELRNNQPTNRDSRSLLNPKASSTIDSELALRGAMKKSRGQAPGKMADVFLPNPRDYLMLAVIGKGNFGESTVSLMRHAQSGRNVAVKRINLETGDIHVSLVQHEIKMHRTLKHKHILPALSSFVNGNEVWLVMPPFAYGSCRDLLHAHFKDGLPETAIAHVLHDVLLGLEYLHNRGIIHRCIKASHILVQSDGVVCLTGLRHCLCMLSNGRRLKMVHEFPDNYVDTLNWASRELLEQNLSGYDTKSDMYSLGITACELANGVVPFQDMPLTQMLLSKIEGTTPRLLDTTTIPELQNSEYGQYAMGADGSSEGIVVATQPFQRTFSLQFHQLVETCLQFEPGHRPSAAALGQHAFFKQIRRKANPATLTELLQPLRPLNASNIAPQSNIDELESKFEDISMNEDWTF